MHCRAIPLLPLCASLVLTACATDEGTYPSLAKRPAERITASWPPPAPPPPPAPAPLEPATLTRLDLLVAEARSADAGFRAKEGRARSLVSAAAGASMGSEIWADASVAVAELEVARAKTMVTMAQLDQLYADARTAGRDTAPIEAARQTVVDMLTAQDAVLGSLRGRLDR